jgi:hypothetical protein
MASASFTLRAVDATKAAFASVQNSLTKLHSTAKIVGTGMATFFGFQAVISGAQRLNRSMEEAEKNAKKLGLSAEDLDALTVATNAVDVAMNKLQAGTAKGVAFIARLFSGTETMQSATEARTTRASDELEKFNEQIKDTIDSINSIVRANPADMFVDIGEKIHDINKEIAESDPSVDLIKNANRRLEIANLEKSQAEIAFASYKSANESLRNVRKTTDEYIESQLTEIQQQDKLNEKLTLYSEIIDQVKAGLGDKLKTFDIRSATSEDIAQFVFLEAMAKEYNELLGKRKVLETDLQIIAREAGSMIAQGFEDAILSGQKLGEVVRSLGRDLVRLVFNQMVTQRLAKGIAVGLSGGGFAGFKADGGPVSAGSSYIVGERGPELFVPRSSGSIVPNEKMTSGGGGMGGVTVNYNIAAGVSRAELAPILEQERKRLKAEIPDMVRRGGGYRAAFA